MTPIEIWFSFTRDCSGTESYSVKNNRWVLKYVSSMYVVVRINIPAFGNCSITFMGSISEIGGCTLMNWEIVCISKLSVFPVWYSVAVFLIWFEKLDIGMEFSCRVGGIGCLEFLKNYLQKSKTYQKFSKNYE